MTIIPIKHILQFFKKSTYSFFKHLFVDNKPRRELSGERGLEFSQTFMRILFQHSISSGPVNDVFAEKK